MANSIFRSAAVRRLSTPDQLDQPLKITTPLGWLALTALMLLIMIGCIASVTITVPVKVPGDGIIIAPAGILDVPIESSGRLAQINVSTGEHVVRGALVARLDQPELRAELEQARADYRDLISDRERVVLFQERSASAHAADDAQRRASLEQSTELVRQRLAFLRERAAILAQLFEKQNVTRQTVVDNAIEIGKAQEEIARDQHQINQLELAPATARIAAERELLDLDFKIATGGRRSEALSDRLTHAESVISPYAGTVVEFKRNPGEMVEKHSALLSLLPDEPDQPDQPDQITVGNPSHGLIAVLFVPGSEGKKTAPGMIAEISPSTFRREEYGFIFGRVRSVAAIPSTEEGMMRILKNRQLVAVLSGGGAPFQLEIDLDRDPATPSGYRWSSSRGPSTTIGPGTLAKGQVWVRQVRLIEILIPALSRFFRDVG